MASIFTFEPDLPRVSSPWHTQLGGDYEQLNEGTAARSVELVDLPSNVTRLESEPQEGSVEYKLHLLLRPRRNFASLRAARDVDTGKHTDEPGLLSHENISSGSSTPYGPLTVQARQHRLEQLTTQLLWRLQQSSPHHTSSASNIILPSLPEALPELQTPQQPEKLLHGLEESQGALYEIGVSDDGAFIGLAFDEMNESLNNLRAMAACLGCVVEVLRMVKVGEAVWFEDNDETPGQPVRRHSKLVVAEAMVKPHYNSRMQSVAPCESEVNHLAGAGHHSLSQNEQAPSVEPTSQMRISLTGATMSGKSSLLGTLSTSTLDNARGKSRLTMLKHRHEITSGITSSVSQELIGYAKSHCGEIDVVNYATDNVTSWIDIHAASQGGRLVFMSDSAGHPRYRRTTVRGLVGWAPHWTFLCVPANDSEENTGVITNSPKLAATDHVDFDLSAAYLDLCLRLEIPLVIVITKLDTASKSGLRTVLAKLLSSLKSAGRRPTIIPNAPGAIPDDDFQIMSHERVAEVHRVLSSADFDYRYTVPIVMTSALQGAGIENLHALMQGLPIPIPMEDEHELTQSNGPLFHIEDVYHKATDPQLNIVAGHLHQGQINIGDELFLGPCSAESEESDESDTQRYRRPSTAPHSRSFPGALRPAQFLAHKDVTNQEWRTMRVVSIRNLRLPANTLLADQVGTLGLRFTDNATTLQTAPRVRKGMVLLRQAGRASSNITAEFRREDLGSLAVGSHVVVYIASVRASARIVSASIPPDENGHAPAMTANTQSSGGIAALSELSLGQSVWENGTSQPVAGAITHEFLHVIFHFETTREFVEKGAKVLVMPGGGPGIFGGGERGEKGVAGLEAFVGKVVDATA
ncbi:hypothetical protein MBLNU457_g2804t1 [Dothideomycetes sp. NU457]